VEEPGIIMSSQIIKEKLKALRLELKQSIVLRSRLPPTFHQEVK
jgi:hypothetical protein